MTNEPWNLGAFAPQCKNAKIGAGNWISASGSTFNCQTCVFDAHCTATLFILHGVMFQKKSCWLRWIASSLSSCIGRFRWSPWALIVSVSAIIFTIPNTIFFIMLRTIVNMMIASDWESPAPAPYIFLSLFTILLFYQQIFFAMISFIMMIVSDWEPPAPPARALPGWRVVGQSATCWTHGRSGVGLWWWWWGWMIKGGEDTSFYQEVGAVHTHYFSLSAHHVVLS